VSRTVSFTDGFNRADNVDLGANWDSGYAGENAATLQIVSNKIQSTDNSGTLNATESVNTLTLSDCWAQVTIATLTGASLVVIKPMIRMSTPAAGFDCYQADLRRNGSWTSELVKYVGGSASTIGSENATTWTAGDVARVEMVSTAIALYRNNTSLLTGTDATIASGRVGMMIFVDAGGTLANAEVDDFSGGPIEDTTIWNLNAYATPTLADLLVGVNDPGGTPATRKILVSDFAKLAITDVVVQIKTVGSGTYTPTSGMKNVLAIGVGGGGGGDAGLATDSAGGGGGGGGTCIKLLTAAQIGASKAYVVGAKGLGRSSTQASTAGTATTIDAAGALLNAGGGSPGAAGAQAAALGVGAAGGAGGTATNGDLNIPGTPGSRGLTYSTTDGKGGKGGSTVFGFGGIENGTNVAGSVGQAYGGGGSAGHASATTDKNGADGADGILYLIEFI
jgi:hypothetical protein